MADNPYQIGDIQYWMDGDIERFNPNSLEFKKAVYGSYNRTTIMSDKNSQISGIQLKLNPNDVTLSKEDALKFAALINQKIEALQIEHKYNTANSKYITISIGLYTQVGQALASTKEIYNFADTAMYEAKESGRNKSVLYVTK